MQRVHQYKNITLCAIASDKDADHAHGWHRRQLDDNDSSHILTTAIISTLRGDLTMHLHLVFGTMADARY